MSHLACVAAINGIIIIMASLKNSGGPYGQRGVGNETRKGGTQVPVWFGLLVNPGPPRGNRTAYITCGFASACTASKERVAQRLVYRLGLVLLTLRVRLPWTGG